MEIDFKVLGSPTLLAAEQREVKVSPQLWCVLLSFLLSLNVPVSADILIDRLWEDNPPAKARTTIRSYIWRVERALSQAANHEVRILRQAHGYALDIEPDAVDLHRFRSLRRQAEALAGSGEIRHAATLLRQAEAIWRGTALDGLPGAWVERMRHTLNEELRATIVRRIDLELTLGDHARLLAELSELSGRYPLDERLASYRMIALFRSGRQADALTVFREIHANLKADGMMPSPDLSELHDRILRHQVEDIPVRPDAIAPPNTLPADVGDFVGRANEIREMILETSVTNNPLIRIVGGMAGIGKTSLAVHIGHKLTGRYPDAQLYLNFRAHDQIRDPLDTADALRDLLLMLGVAPDRIPRTLPERTELWRTELARRRSILIFDDVVGPDQTRPLIPVTGDCLIIVTSRRRHHSWSGSHHMIGLTLPTLSEDDAAALFTRTAGRATAQELGQITQINRLCEYLPLAIRLAASQVRAGVSTVADLLDELADPHGASKGVHDIHHRIRAAFELSYRQLGISDKRLFRYIGISPCINVTPESAAVICDCTGSQAESALAMLSSHHLLGEVSPSRYGFHDLTRAFAAGRFAIEDPEHEARLAMGRLADYYMRAGRQTADGPHNRPWLEAEWANVLCVAKYCGRHELKRRCADLVHVLSDFLEASGHWDEALEANLVALQACRDLDDVPRIARAAFSLSLTSLRTGRCEEALQQATEAAELFGALGDKNGRAAALDRIGIVHRNTARFREALAYHREAIDIYRNAGNQRGLAKALSHTGVALGELGRHEEEMRCLNEALDLYRGLGDLRGQAITFNNIGNVQHMQGYHRDAERSYAASLDIFREIGGRQSIALIDHNLGQLYEYKGNYSAAIARYRDVLATYRTIGDLQHQAHALVDIGSVYNATDRFDEAIAHYEKAASLGEAAGDHSAAARALCGTAEAHFGAGRLSAALETYERVIRLSGEIESLYLKAKALNGTAEIVLQTRGLEAARIYWREAHDIFAQLGVPEAATVEIRLQALGAPVSLAHGKRAGTQ